MTSAVARSPDDEAVANLVVGAGRGRADRPAEVVKNPGGLGWTVSDRRPELAPSPQQAAGLDVLEPPFVVVDAALVYDELEQVLQAGTETFSADG